MASALQKLPAVTPLWIRGYMIDSLFGHGLALGAEDHAHLKTLGIDLRVVEARYPLETFHRALDWARDRFFPWLSAAEGDRALGRYHLQGYGKTLLGSAVMAGVRTLTPGQLLDRYPRYVTKSRDGASAEVEHLGERSRRIQYRAVCARPEFIAGSLLECLTFTDALGCVEIVQCEPDFYTLTFTW